MTHLRYLLLVRYIIIWCIIKPFRKILKLQKKKLVWIFILRRCPRRRFDMERTSPILPPHCQELRLRQAGDRRHHPRRDQDIGRRFEESQWTANSSGSSSGLRSQQRHLEGHVRQENWQAWRSFQEALKGRSRIAWQYCWSQIDARRKTFPVSMFYKILLTAE